MTDPANAPRPSAWRRLGRTLKGFLLWEHQRTSWQYDVMCLVIFLFVVLTPARYFHDKPVYRPSSAAEVVRLEAGAEGVRYRLSAALLARYGDDPRQAARQVLARERSTPVELTRIQPIRADDGTIVWYDVWVRGD